MRYDPTLAFIALGFALMFFGLSLPAHPAATDFAFASLVIGGVMTATAGAKRVFDRQSFAY